MNDMPLDISQSAPQVLSRLCPSLSHSRPSHPPPPLPLPPWAGTELPGLHPTRLAPPLTQVLDDLPKQKTKMKKATATKEVAEDAAPAQATEAVQIRPHQ